MRWRVLFLSLLGVNLALGVVWLVSTHRHRFAPVVADLAEGGSGTVRTNVMVRRQFFSWSEVESSDYPTYISNLRGIGCPEQTIRDIIIADVNAMFARKLATDVTTPEQQWWRSSPDPVLVRAATEKIRALNAERRALLTHLLGANWESGDLANLPRPSRPGVTLDGPVLGVLPAETKQAVQEISARAQGRLQSYLDAQRLQGKQPDPVELARLRQQTRSELTQTLTPLQVEEYLLRYSQEASNLRAELGRLKYFNARPEEFRNLFRSTDPIDQQLELLAGNNDPNVAAQRNVLQQQRDNAVKLALGGDRYQEYESLQDPLYRDAYATAQQSDNPGAAQLLYQINQAVAQQQAAIRADTNMTDEQRAIELKRIELEQLQAHAQAMGQEAPADSTPPVVQPEPPATTSPTHSYVMGMGESAATIAMQFGLSINALKEANPGLDLRKLKAGDAIKIPGPGRVMPATPPPQ